MKALELDSDRWHELHHAYGTAHDTPLLLNESRPARRRRPDRAVQLHPPSVQRVLSVVRAAAPHLVRVAGRLAEGEFNTGVICLIGSIRAWSARSDLERLPRDIREWYEAALVEARPVAEACLERNTSKQEAIYLL